MSVVEVREVICRVVEIDIVIIVTVQVRTNVVASAHRNHPAKQIGMLEVFVGGEKCAETRSSRNGTRIRAIFIPNQRQHFIYDVPIITSQQFGLQLWRHLLVEQAVTIDAVD